MENLTATEPTGTVELSTTLDPKTVKPELGGGKPSLSDDAGPSIEDVLAEEAKRLREEDSPKPDEKAEADKKAEEAAKEAKAEADKAKAEEKAKADKQRDERGKFAKAEPQTEEAKADEGEPEKAADERADGKQRQSEGPLRREPPARLLPKEREQWANVPHVVKGAWERMEAEHKAEIERHRASSERYEQLRYYDETARRNGRDLTQSLQKVAQIEQALARNPVMGLEMILREIGPRKPDGGAFSLHDIAVYVAKQSPQQFQQAMGQQLGQVQAQTQARQSQEQIQRLTQELQTMKVVQQAEAIIAPFRASHPRFDELEADIAFFLNSGKIPASLSPEARLEAAYDMAERINPSPVDAPSAAKAPADAKPAKVDKAGAKSIRGAPDDGFDPAVEEDDADSIEEQIRREMKRLRSA